MLIVGALVYRFIASEPTQTSSSTLSQGATIGNAEPPQFSFGGPPMSGGVEHNQDTSQQPRQLPNAAPAEFQQSPIIQQNAKPESKSAEQIALKVRAIKVSVHERQRVGAFARSAGYNGSFELTGTRSSTRIEEIADILRNGRVVRSQSVQVVTRKPGRFKSKQRIPDLKTLQPGRYEVRLRFVAGERTIGSHQWKLNVG